MPRARAVLSPAVPPVVRRVGRAGLQTISFTWLSGATTAIDHDPPTELLTLYLSDVSGSDLDVAIQGIMDAFTEMARSIRIMLTDLGPIRFIVAGERPSIEERSPDDHGDR